MLTQPEFKSHLQIEVVESVGVFLVTESESFLLTGRAYELAAPLIDGRHAVEQIVEELQDRISPAEIYYALMTMKQDGYIVEASDLIPPQVAAIADLLGADRMEALYQLKTKTVGVKSFGAVDREPLVAKLKSLYIQVEDSGDIDIVLTDDYLREELATYNQQALIAKRPWMLVKPTGTTFWMGPLFVPDQTGCWDCLGQRLRANCPVESFIQNKTGISKTFPSPASLFPTPSQAALEQAAIELVKWIVRPESSNLEGKLVTLDAIALETQSHILVKRPQCQTCGELEGATPGQPAPIVLASRQKTFTEDGGHRTSSPEATLRKYQHHVSPLIGAVKELYKVSMPSEGSMHLYYSGHNLSKMANDLYFLRQGGRGSSAGKGKTDQQAKASALCEALERYSALFQGDEIRYSYKGSYKEMATKMGEAAIHPNACMNYSEEQYRTRQEWNQRWPGGFNLVREPFDEEAEIEWTPVWSLTNGAFKYLPTAFCYFGYPHYPNLVCGTDSNGNAAGNNQEEAIIQGFMELVERDSIALWWYNRVKRPAVDLDSFNEPYCQALQESYQAIKRELWVLDLTSDFNIPVFVAISRRTDRPLEDIIFGFGAHFDPKIALLRALTEMNQILPSVPSAEDNGHETYHSWDPLADYWWQTATIENQPYLVADESVPAKKYGDYLQLGSEDLYEEVMTCVEMTKQLGMEMLVLDQTRPDIGLSVAKVIVPGMRHFWKRLAPGRLYDVPVKLGWLDAALKEEELNPIPVFF